MVAKVHHATLAKAAKLGFTFDSELDSPFYAIRWIERNRVATGSNASQLVTDMALVKMLALEYPALKTRQVPDGWSILFDGAEVAGGETLEAAWDAFCAEQEGDDWADDYQETDQEADDLDQEEERGGGDTDEEGEDDGRSVVKKAYKRAYKPFKSKCGDDLSKLISAHLQFKDEDGRVRTDEAKLEAFAKANDCWVNEYRFLNVGMRRMNVANRLRGKVKKGGEVIWS